MTEHVRGDSVGRLTSLVGVGTDLCAVCGPLDDVMIVLVIITYEEYYTWILWVQADAQTEFPTLDRGGAGNRNDF